jgi:hypothetical protein
MDESFTIDEFCATRKSRAVVFTSLTLRAKRQKLTLSVARGASAPPHTKHGEMHEKRSPHKPKESL